MGQAIQITLDSYSTPGVLSIYRTVLRAERGGVSTIVSEGQKWRQSQGVNQKAGLTDELLLTLSFIHLISRSHLSHLLLRGGLYQGTAFKDMVKHNLKTNLGGRDFVERKLKEILFSHVKHSLRKLIGKKRISRLKENKEWINMGKREVKFA